MLYTGRLGNRSNKGTTVDVTVKSARSEHKIFAPTWDMVMGHKRGQLSDAQYTTQYHDRMVRSYREHTRAWHDFVKRCAAEDITIACYCAEGAFCHRKLLAVYLRWVAKKLGLVI